jgi:hypothetical protein
VASIAWSEPTLASLALSSGTLNPEFAATTKIYTANVPNNVTAIAITPTAADASLSLTVNGSTLASGSASAPISLNVGANVINVVVTAGDGATLNNYTVTVTRPASSNADLAGLACSSGNLNPNFTSNTTSYTVNVPNTVTSLTLTPTVSDPTASVTVNGTAVVSGSPSAAIALNVGTNTINVVVTAQDGTTKAYSVAVARSEHRAPNRKQILVTGCGYVLIRDAQSGENNAAYNDIAVKRIPGVEATYNAGASWVLVEFDEARHIVMNSVPGTTAAEIEVITRTATGELVDVVRYRSTSESAPWKLDLQANQSPVLSLDRNSNGAFEPSEQVAPHVSTSGASIDMNPPDVGLVLSVVGENIRLVATGTDAEGAPVVIRYQIDNGALTDYEAPILLPRNAQNSIALYAEDAQGNSSGLIRTQLNPPLALRTRTTTTFELEWPEADGYRLQTASTPQGPWIDVATTPVVSGGRITATVTPGKSSAFYRLAAYPVTR